MSKSVLHCENLSKVYRDAGKRLVIFEDLDFKVAENEMAAIIGVSGSGKSSLLHLLGGLDKPSEGKVFWGEHLVNRLPEGKKCYLRNRHLGFIYQFHHLLLEFTCVENVAMPLLIRGYSCREAANEARDFLKKVGLKDRLSHKMEALSGGERQRVAIARALVSRPQCVLGDEPTGNLDRKTSNEVFGNMLDLQREMGTSFVIVTHSLHLASQMGTCYTMRDGKLRRKDKKEKA